VPDTRVPAVFNDKVGSIPDSRLPHTPTCCSIASTAQSRGPVRSAVRQPASSNPSTWPCCNVVARGLSPFNAVHGVGVSSPSQSEMHGLRRGRMTHDPRRRSAWSCRFVEGFRGRVSAAAFETPRFLFQNGSCYWLATENPSSISANGTPRTTLTPPTSRTPTMNWNLIAQQTPVEAEETDVPCTLCSIAAPFCRSLGRCRLNLL
jgi:hypothetical protein